MVKKHICTHTFVRQIFDYMDLIYRFLIAFVVFLLIFLSSFFGVNFVFVQINSGQNSSRIKEENGLKLNLNDEDTETYWLQNYKPLLNARKKKVKEVCQKYNLASGMLKTFDNIFCSFQYKVRNY